MKDTALSAAIRAFENFFEPFRSVTSRISPRTWIVLFGGAILAGQIYRYASYSQPTLLWLIAPWLIGMAVSVLGDYRRIHFRVPWVTVIVVIWITMSFTAHAVLLSKRFLDESLITEAALDGLSRGHNPYAMDYRGTIVDRWLPSPGVKDYRPPTDRFVYFPGHLLLSIPVYFPLRLFTTWYEQRLVYFIIFLLTLLLVWKALKKSLIREPLVLSFALYPFVIFMMYSFNDLLAIFLLVIFGIAIAQKKILFAAAAYGAAIATKQPVLLTMPFLLPPLLQRAEEMGSSKPKILSIIILVFGVIITPFLLWSPGNFLSDTVTFFLANNQYPISSEGASGLLLKAGFIGTYDNFPFWIFQIVISFPLLVLLYRWSLQQRSLQRSFMAAALGIAAVWFFSRYFAPAHISAVMILVALSFIIGEVERTATSP